MSVGNPKSASSKSQWINYFFVWHNPNHDSNTHCHIKTTINNGNEKGCSPSLDRRRGPLKPRVKQEQQTSTFRHNDHHLHPFSPLPFHPHLHDRRCNHANLLWTILLETRDAYVRYNVSFALMSALANNQRALTLLQVSMSEQQQKTKVSHVLRCDGHQDPRRMHGHLHHDNEWHHAMEEAVAQCEKGRLSSLYVT
jgi:hypothetical protein